MENTFFDCLGNSDDLIISNKINPIFKDKDFYDSVPDYLDYYAFSTIINKSSHKTLDDISDDLLRNMQKIEMLLYQFLLGRTLTDSDYNVMCNYYELQNRVKDGHVSGAKFSSVIGRENETAITPILLMENITFLHNVILDEFYHAEYRMLDSINSQIEDIKVHSKRLGFGHEIRSFTKYSDNSALCIQDAWKAIYKVLDIISKWLLYIKDYKNLKTKIPQAYFSDAEKETISKLHEGKIKMEIIKLFKGFKFLTLVRNEITHNLSFNRNRQHLYTGRATEGICEKKLYYSELLLWDNDNSSIVRSNGKVGFFTQNVNALSETRQQLVNAIAFVNMCLNYYFEIFADEIANLNISNVFLWEGRPDTLVAVQTNDLSAQFIDILTE